MKKKLALTTSILALSLLCACSKDSDKTKEAEQLTIPITVEAKAKQLDANSYNAAMPLYGAVYEPLVEYGEKGKFRPGIAKSWDIEENAKRYTFHIDKGQYFSDGSRLTADAIKFSIERAKTLNQTTTLQTLLNLKSIETPDDYTIVLNFSKTSNQILNELCQVRPLRIMSPHAVKGGKVDGKFIKPIGSGALTVDSSDTEETVLKANPYFNKKHPIQYGVTFKTITDASARTLALKSGEADLLGGTISDLTDTDIKALKKTFNKETYPGTMSHFLAFNPDNKRLNKEIREAIDLSIDKRALSSKKLSGIFQPTVQFVTTNNQAKTAFNPNKAKTLLEKNGYRLNKNKIYEKDGKALEFSLVLQTAEFPTWKEKAEIIESQLKKVGIKTNITIMDSETYYETLWTSKKYDFILYRTYTDALLPYTFMKSLFYNSTETPGVLAKDQELSRLIDDFESKTSTKDQQKQFDVIFSYFNQQHFAIPVEYKSEQFITSKKIKEFAYTGLSDDPIDYEHLSISND